MRGNVDSRISFMFTVTTESMIGQERKKVRSPRGPHDLRRETWPFIVHTISDNVGYVFINILSLVVLEIQQEYLFI
jgi:hypothetical protein